MFYTEGTQGGRLSSLSSPIGPSLEVATVSLSDVIEEAGSVDLLKVDIEGAEMAVLAEARPMLGRVARLFVEYHSFAGREQQLGQLLMLLEEEGFRYYLETPFHVKHPFLGVPIYLGQDLACNIHAWR